MVRYSMNRSLDQAKLLYVTDRWEWRDWLEKHYKSEKDVWLVYFKKHTGKPRIPYNDAVLAALRSIIEDMLITTAEPTPRRHSLTLPVDVAQLRSVRG